MVHEQGQDDDDRKWDSDQPKQRASTETHFHLLWTLRDDHKRFALGSRQGAVWQWDLTMGRRLDPVADFHQPCQTLRYSPDGRWLAVSGDDGDVGLFDPLTGKQAGPLLTQGVPVRGLAFHVAGHELHHLRTLRDKYLA